MIDWERSEFQDYTGMSVLVTGSTGFIGHRLVQILNMLNANVTQVSRGHRTQNVNIQKCDLSNYDACLNLFQKNTFDIIFHLAGWVSSETSIENIREAHNNNVAGTINLLDASKTSSTNPKIVIPGSTLEHSEIQNPYSVSKAATSLYTDLFRNQYGADTASLNICLTYGPRQSLNSLIPYTINSLITAEKKVNLKLNRYLDILFVDDVINAMLKAGLSLGSIRPTYIGTSQNITVKEITTLIAELMDKDHNLIEFDLDTTSTNKLPNENNINPAKDCIGWSPQWSLPEGLKKTISWYLNETQV